MSGSVDSVRCFGGGRWISRSEVVECYGLSWDQVDYAIFAELVRYKRLGGSGVIVYREDLEKCLEELRKLPQRIWVYKSEAMRRYGLTSNQIDVAIKQGIVRFREVKNPYHSSSKSIQLVLMDLEANLEKLKSLPRYSEEEKEARKVYSKRYRMRRELEFHCPRCGKHIRPLRGSQAFEEFWRSGGGNKEELLEKIIVAHYRHNHTEYDLEKGNIDRWIGEEDVKELAPGGFKTFKELLKWYQENKHEMDSFEREHYIGILNTLRSIAVERAKKHYTAEARRLAEQDGLVKHKTSTEKTGTT